MGFTRTQQIMYRTLVKRAWDLHCASERINPKDKIAHDAWYRATLHEGVGVFTTKDCNPRGDFERAMAAFEVLIGDSIYWQLKADGGDLKRARHALDTVMRDHYIEEEYVAGIARQMFDTTHHNLNFVQLGKLIAALKIHLQRKAEPVVRPDLEPELEPVEADIPF